MNKPATANEATFQRAIDEVAKVTEQLLAELPARGPARTRENEREKARVRWKKREVAMNPRTP